MSETLFEPSGSLARAEHNLFVDSSRLVFLIALAWDAMAFVALCGVFLILRSEAAYWPPSDLSTLSPEVAVASSICLALAALLLWLAVVCQNKNKLVSMRVGLFLALVSLVCFLGMNAIEWHNAFGLAHDGQTVFGNVYLALTGGFHLHIIVCTLYLARRYRRTLRWRRYTRSSLSIARASQVVLTLMLVWMGIIAVIYL